MFAGLSKLVGDANSKSEKIRESLLDPSITNNVSKVNKTKMHKNMIWNRRTLHPKSVSFPPLYGVKLP